MTVVKIGNRYYQQSPPASAPATVYSEPSLPPPSVSVRIPPIKEDRLCGCGIPDEYGRRPVGWCGPECEGRPLRGRHRRRA